MACDVCEQRTYKQGDSYRFMQRIGCNRLKLLMDNAGRSELGLGKQRLVVFLALEDVRVVCPHFWGYPSMQHTWGVFFCFFFLVFCVRINIVCKNCRWNSFKQ